MSTKMQSGEVEGGQDLFESALSLHRRGALAEAEAACRAILASQRTHFGALHLCGVIAGQAGRSQEAVELLDRALQGRPDDPNVLDNLGNALRNLGRHGEAERCHRRSLELRPGNPQVLSNLGIVLKDQGRADEALETHDQALRLRPDYAEAHNNRGSALVALARYAEAVASFDAAIGLRPAYVEALNNRGIALKCLGDHEALVDNYDRLIALRPDDTEAHWHRGNALLELKQPKAALQSYDRVLELDPAKARVHTNCGVARGLLRQHRLAVACYDKAIALKPDYVRAHANRGYSLMLLKDHAGALRSFEAALALEPDYEFLAGIVAHTRMHLCAWEGIEPWLAQLGESIAQGKKAVPPFVALSLFDSPELHRQAAATFAQALAPADVSLAPPAVSPGEGKIRLGYFSADFRTHATAVLAAEMFERHDRTRFEITAFSLGAPTDDPTRRRLVASFDRFIDVNAMPDVAVARLARELRIDIAVDLNGFTTDSRTGIFAVRAAPLQVGYLGYPGTMAAPYFDYVIGDATVIPRDGLDDYSEKVVFLPDSYQVNDAGRAVAPESMSRDEAGLPPSGFVFCCFNNNYKITPEVFGGWMRILERVPGSVLWLLQDSPVAAENLRNEATRAGVDAGRLVFGSRLPLAKHLARHRLAQLFLDTLPYNAHTTASDALWAGVPVLTRMGRSFPSRVAASLLGAVGLPELVTNTADAYEDLAVALASDAPRLAALRAKLEQNRLTLPLFDCAAFTRHIEAAYVAMHDRQRAGLPPAHIDVPRIAPAAAAPSRQQLFRQGVALHGAGRLDEARKCYAQVLAQQPDHFDALHLGGVAAAQAGEPAVALDLIRAALAIRPKESSAHNNLGNVLHGLQRHDDAVASYERAIALAPDYAEAFCNRGNALRDAGRHAQALESFDRAVQLMPDYADAQLGRANALLQLRALDTALQAYDDLIATQPALAQAHANRGVALVLRQRHREAIESYDKAIALNPAHAPAQAHRALALADLKDHAGAVAGFARALQVDPQHEFLAGAHLHSLMCLCDWATAVPLLDAIAAGIERNLRVATPYVAMVSFDSLRLHRLAARTWITAKLSSAPVPSPAPSLPAHGRIRVGYYSADFRNHAMASLTAEMFERHDRARFELVAFSFGGDSSDPMRHRLVAAFDRFIDVSAMSDAEVTRLSRELEIDVAVDLMGFTAGSRAGIFAARAAPVQVSYLGYASTMGAGFIDYLIADPVLVPAQSRGGYSEKIAWLPDSYMANDGSRPIARERPTREEAGLPAEGVVYCCFNNVYKITPQVFGSWMRILEQVPGSVLWLLQDNDDAVANLRRHAADRGIDPARLVFAARTGLPQHLARHALADLFLDTLPCNAHTTASDALWAGLPVLTRAGESLPSRVASSLLHAIGLPELVATTAREYEELAVALALDANRLAALRARLRENRTKKPLFDCATFTRHIEAAFAAMHERRRAGLAPDHIEVARGARAGQGEPR